MKTYSNLFAKTISVESLFRAWNEFKRGKEKKKDVLRFEFQLEENLFALAWELQLKTYHHGSYTSFTIRDPKERQIRKALVRDRIIHHAVFAALNPIFEKSFIYDSYSCRIGKGTHKAVKRLDIFLRRASLNRRKPCYLLKCDVRKFYHSINHAILLNLVFQKIKDPDMQWLIREIIDSFSPGLPIGNLTSQLFGNIYLNKLDRFVKQTLRAPFYIRYADDFVLVHTNTELLREWLRHMGSFLERRLKLQLHPQKIIFRTYHQGIDFLGYIQHMHHRLVRTRTKRRIEKRITKGISENSLQSYLGVLSHADGFRLSRHMKYLYCLFRKQ